MSGWWLRNLSVHVLIRFITSCPVGIIHALLVAGAKLGAFLMVPQICRLCHDGSFHFGFRHAYKCCTYDIISDSSCAILSF
jgi:hypothetical protein